MTTLTAKLNETQWFRLKGLAYLVYLQTFLIPLLGWWLGVKTGYLDLFAWLTPLEVFVLIPLLDYWIGNDTRNPSTQTEESLRDNGYYRILPLLALPGYFLFLFWAMSRFDSFGLLGQIGWLVTAGLVGGTMAINVAHELIHKPTKLESRTGGLLLSLVTFGSFKIEHIRGHHVNVATPLDISTAPFGWTIFKYMRRAIPGNLKSAIDLQRQMLNRKGQAFWSHHNELLVWYGFSLGWLMASAFFFGWLGALFFVLSSILSILLLETVNYLEHYGLARREVAPGKYEKTTHLHSWNSNALLTNLLLLQLQRHSDHHAVAYRRYQTLRQFDDSPQLPAGYSTMLLLAWFPPLWFKVMNPRVEAIPKPE